MTREELTALVDRVIGSKGILRTPSYWMKKVLNNIIGYLENYGDQNTYDVKVQLDSLSEEVNMLRNTIPLYLTAIAQEDDMTISFTRAYSYSVDGGGWVFCDAETITPAFSKDQVIRLKATPNPDEFTSDQGVGIFTFSKKVRLEGTVLSMLYGDNVVSSPLPEHAFAYMFYNCPITSVNVNLLPSTRLGDGCYNCMFRGCTELTNAPFLPATQLKKRCYTGMFHNCKSITSAPSLPSMTMKQECYLDMFYNCSSLVNAPALPAMELALRCYSNMFEGCSSLVNAPALPAETLSDSCYYAMFEECSSLTTAPELLARTLVRSCYGRMFRDCDNLSYVKMLATDGLDSPYCLDIWLADIAGTGTIVKAKGVTLPSGTSGIPEGWSVEEVEV